MFLKDIQYKFGVVFLKDYLLLSGYKIFSSLTSNNFVSELSLWIVRAEKFLKTKLKIYENFFYYSQKTKHHIKLIIKEKNEIFLK